LKEAQLAIWDGRRPLSNRKVLIRRDVRIGQVAITVAAESLLKPTDWTLNERHNSIVIHLGGHLDRMEYAFSRGPSGSAIPSPGDIWMISADSRYAALAQGTEARFVELGVPTALLADIAMPSRARHRDDFLAKTTPATTCRKWLPARSSTRCTSICSTATDPAAEPRHRRACRRWDA